MTHPQESLYPERAAFDSLGQAAEWAINQAELGVLIETNEEVVSTDRIYLKLPIQFADSDLQTALERLQGNIE